MDRPRTGSIIRRLRARAGLSQRDLGALSGISHTQIGRYENGAEPTLPVAQRVAEALGVTLDELAGRGEQEAC